MPPEELASADATPARSGRSADRGRARLSPPALCHAGLAPGIEPHELSALQGAAGSARVTCIDYCRDQVRIERVDDIPDFIARHRPEWSAVRWINVDGLTDTEVIRVFAEKYELHPLAIEDVLHRGQRPKAEDYPASEEHPGRLFVVAHLVQLANGNPCSQQIALFLGRKTLVTFREQATDVFAPIVQRIEACDSRLRRGDASFLLYSLLDAIVDQFFPVLDDLSSRSEALEDAAIAGAGGRRLLNEIHHFRHEVTALRRIAWPMRELIDVLHRQHHECLSDETRTYLRDVYDHLMRTLDLLETYREVANSVTEMHMYVASNRLSDIMKTLTIISTIFVPLTFLAGVYGMNMPIPENQYAWTYPVFWLVALVAAGGMLYWFRRRGWF
jgi:magnesium transporter